MRRHRAHPQFTPLSHAGVWALSAQWCCVCVSGRFSCCCFWLNGQLKHLGQCADLCTDILSLLLFFFFSFPLTLCRISKLDIISSLIDELAIVWAGKDRAFLCDWMLFVLFSFLIWLWVCLFFCLFAWAFCCLC